MAITEVGTQYIKTFEGNIQHLVQQKTSKLRHTVTEKAPGSISHAFRVIAARGAMAVKANAGTNAGKRNATPYLDSVWNDRTAIPVPYGTADSYEWDDLTKMLVDPQSVLTQSMAAQVGRRFDDTIIAAATATATDSLGTAGLVLPVPQQLGGAAIPPSFALVQTVKESILERDVDPDEEVFFVVSPNFVSVLMNDAKATSIDYVNGKALQSGGIVQGWMGFTWICSNRLTRAVVGPPAQIYGLAYTRDALGLVVNKDVFVKVGEDPGQSFATTVYAAMEIGAVRVQDEKMFRVHYLEGN